MGLVVGAGGTGDANTLYFTAGLAEESHGLFGAITTAAPTPDYSLVATPQNASVAAGGSATIMLTVVPVNGFAGTVNLSCAAPTGVTCAFNPPTVTPRAGAVTSQLTVTTSSALQSLGRVNGMGVLLGGMGLFGISVVGEGRSRRKVHFLLSPGFASILITMGLLSSTGCGGGNARQTNVGTASIVVTATSGALHHTSTVHLTFQ